jgi:uncharacterized protein (TIGR01244 family)
MRIRSTLALLAVLAAAPSFASSQKITGASKLAVLPAPEKLDIEGRFQSTFAKVGDDLYIAGQPTERGLRELHDLGVTTVVNLRTPEEMTRDVKFDEPALIAKLGMKYVYLPVRGNAEFPYSPKTVTAFSQALKDANGKVLLHCTIAWRASHLWAAYLISERGIAVDSALANARAINLMDDMRHGSGDGPQPVEDFLGRRLPTLRHP